MLWGEGVDVEMWDVVGIRRKINLNCGMYIVIIYRK